MPVRIESNAEPIPGYTLIERLGGGGFGEVWKAKAPGGMHKAIKFVYGDLQTMDDEDGLRAEQELKSLERVKTVRHAYILSLERYEIIEGQLVIVMELADRTLWDRFKECRNQGLPGIPREEMLSYLRETAEVLDLMNNEYQLQHLDIKPQNLFLVHNHVKVADFGLVKDLGGMGAATITGGVTPVYAAPETFDGKVSRFSDQYSLAIVYQELLTGQRPFVGATMRQLVLQHLQGTPDLSGLPAADQPIIARCLSKNPDDRYPTCLEMMHALQSASRVQAGGEQAVPDAAVSEVPLPRPQDAADGSDKERDQGSELLDPEKTRASKRKSPKKTEQDAVRRKAITAAPRPAEATGAPQDSQPLSLTARIAMEERARFQREAIAAAHPEGILQPALIIGLGGIGLGALRQLRRELNEHFGMSEALPHLRFLHLDTDPEANATATRGTSESALRNGEVLVTPLHRASHYLKPKDGKAPLDSWLNPKLLYRIPRTQSHAGIRPLGRLAFVDYCRSIARRLEAELNACCAPETLRRAVEYSGLQLRSPVPRVYIVTSLAGGTGSGMFLDLAYLARHLLKKQGHALREVIGLFMLPPTGRPTAAQTPGLANTHAALMELSHFSAADAVFQASYDVSNKAFGGKPFQEKGPAFTRCVLLHQEKTAAQLERGSHDDPAIMLSQAAHYLANDLTTPLGRLADEQRGRALQGAPDGGTIFQTVGQYRILWPRRQLLQQAGRHLARRLVQHWMSKDSKRISAEVRQWAIEQWDANELRTENLIARHQERLEKILKQAPDHLLMGVVSPLTGLLTGPAEATLNLAPVVQAMDHLEKIIGVPDECRGQTAGTGQESEPGTVEKALSAASAQVAAECEQKLSELVVRLIEEPRYRLAGAEESLRQFTTNVEQALKNHEQLARELQERAAALYRRIGTLLESPATPVTQSASIWRVPFTRRTPQVQQNVGAELVELLKSYPKCRYQSLILQHITGLYVSLRGLLSDQMREIGFCRQRLSELADLVDDRRPPADPYSLPQLESVAQLNECLLPGGCETLDEAVKQLDSEVSAEDLRAFDEKMQILLRGQYRALVNVCLATSNILKALAPTMQGEAEAFLAGRLDQANVVDLYLARHQAADGADSLRSSLTKAFDGAAPPAEPRTAHMLTLVAVPAGEPGDRLREVAQSVLPDLRFALTDRTDEVTFFRETGDRTLGELPHLGPAGQQAYRAAPDPSCLHTRNDIAEWRSPVAVSV
jgi:serine/threonine protein kinase